MNSNEDKPASPSARPSLYKPDSTTSFSILDAATVQGKPKRAKAVPPEAAPTQPNSRRRWPIVLAGFLAVGGIVAIALTSQDDSSDTDSPTVAAKPPVPATKPTAPTSAAVAPAGPEAVANAAPARPALVEQLEAPSEKEFTPTGADPLSILEADHSKLDAQQKTPAAAKPKANPPVATSVAEQPKKPTPTAKVASGKPATPNKPETTKPHRDGDIDFMEAVLSRLPKPEPRTEATPEPAKAE